MLPIAHHINVSCLSSARIKGGWCERISIFMVSQPKVMSEDSPSNRKSPDPRSPDLRSGPPKDDSRLPTAVTATTLYTYLAISARSGTEENLAGRGCPAMGMDEAQFESAFDP